MLGRVGVHGGGGLLGLGGHGAQQKLPLGRVGVHGSAGLLDLVGDGAQQVCYCCVCWNCWWYWSSRCCCLQAWRRSCWCCCRCCWKRKCWCRCRCSCFRWCCVHDVEGVRPHLRDVAVREGVITPPGNVRALNVLALPVHPARQMARGDHIVPAQLATPISLVVPPKCPRRIVPIPVGDLHALRAQPLALCNTRHCSEGTSKGSLRPLARAREARAYRNC